MPLAIYRITLAVSLALQAVFGAVILVLPLDRIAPQGITLDPGTGVNLGCLVLFTAWCSWLALQWSATRPRQSAQIGLGLGVMLVTMGILQARVGVLLPLLFDGLRGAALLVTAPLLLRRTA